MSADISWSRFMLSENWSMFDSFHTLSADKLSAAVRAGCQNNAAKPAWQTATVEANKAIIENRQSANYAPRGINQ